LWGTADYLRSEREKRKDIKRGGHDTGNGKEAHGSGLS
jgi:hypothetical protein